MHFGALREALVRTRQGDWTGAADLYAEVLQIEPDSLAGLLGLAACQERLRRPGLACKYYTRALEHAPLDQQARFRLATCLIECEQFKESLEHLELILARSPDHGASHSRKGFVLFMLGDLEAALDCLLEALQRNRRDHQGWNVLGLVYIRQNDQETAMRCFQTSLRLNPRFKAARHNLETLRNRQLRDYGLEGNRDDALRKLIHIKKQQGHWEEAADHLQQLMDDFAHEGQLDKALEIGEELYTFHRSEVVILRIILIHQRRGQLERAACWSLKLLKLYREQKVFDRCLALLDRMTKLAPLLPEATDFELGVARVELLADLGSTEEARQELRRLSQRAKGLESNQKLVASALRLGILPS